MSRGTKTFDLSGGGGRGLLPYRSALQSHTEGGRCLPECPQQTPPRAGICAGTASLLGLAGGVSALPAFLGVRHG